MQGAIQVLCFTFYLCLPRVGWQCVCVLIVRLVRDEMDSTKITMNRLNFSLLLLTTELWLPMLRCQYTYT